VKAYYCDHFILPLPAAHSFPMAKYSRLRELVVAEGTIAPGRLLEPGAATRGERLLAHDATYVDAVLTGTLAPDHQRRIGFPWSPEMVERSRRSVGGTIAAARAALLDGVGINLAGGTHHAFAGRGEGYCVFNDIAVAARVLQATESPGRGPIAVIDCDVHQGNGTAAIFRDDPSVFTFSMHGEKNFPFRKEASDLDVALADGTGDDDYLEQLGAALDVVMDQKPAFVFYLAGADAYAGDRLGRLALTIDGMRRRDALVFERCRRLPVAVTMGGGYCPDIDTIARIHANTIAMAAYLFQTTPNGQGPTSK
jgi:acetoin utilization deacetylase AcuC-like enzyme